MLARMDKQSGFNTGMALGILLVLTVIGFAGYALFNQRDERKAAQGTQANVVSPETKQNKNSCNAAPVIVLPVESQRIKSVLYPGQVRGNNFKPHGGFILNGTNDAHVTLPIAARVIDGARYIEAGEIQYMFDFEADCGYRFRLDHLHTLSSAMQKIADELPQPTEDSRTTKVSSDTLEPGTLLASRVGFIKNNNTSFDFGFYDMNKQNSVSKEASWPTDSQYQTELAKHGVCWFDYLSENDEALIRSLPGGDGMQGKNSVYCK